MRTQFNPQINNNTSFKGLFLAKGTPGEIQKINNEYRNEYLRTGESFPIPKDKLSSYEAYYIMPREAAKTQMVFATNDDSLLFDDFIYNHGEKYNNIYYHDCNRSYREINAERDFKCGGNLDDYLDMLSDKKKSLANALEEAETFISHFLYEFEIPKNQFKEYDASDILKAIKQECFDFANGIIRIYRK